MTLRKFVYWTFNFHEPKKWIEYISGDDKNMFNHLMEKWKTMKFLYSDSAFCRFFVDLDKEQQSKLEEYIDNNYKFE